MEYSATFCFHKSLNDFLSNSLKGSVIAYNFNGAPAIKDAIEAIGIPHTEVRMIVVNNHAVGFDYPLGDEDEVQVFPFEERGEALKDMLSIKPLQVRFILDVHLGKLAKSLRMLGLDTIYENNLPDKTIAEIAASEDRIVLTRDVGLLKHKAIKYGYWLRSQNPEEQLSEVIKRYSLSSEIKPFTKCLACNGDIIQVSKDDVLELLPPKTKDYFNAFFQCKNCKRVYWKGSHYERMIEFIKQLRLP
jgi:uncharacterized protein